MKKLHIVFTFILSAMLAWNSAIKSQTAVYPPDEQFKPVPIPELARPGYLVPVKDPAFGTQIIRITDSAAFGQKNVRHHYSKDQPWNCDQTLILMDKWILDGKTYKILRKMDIPEEPRWSFKNPDKLFGVKENSFISFNTTTGKITTIHTFPEFTRILIGPWEGNLSTDDRYVAFQGSVERTNYIVVFDIRENKVLASKKALDLGPYNEFDWVCMSPSGKYVVVNWRQRNSGDGGAISYDRNLNKIADLFARGEHGDMGFDALGNEVFVQVCPFQYARLDTGEKTSFFDKSCGHMSLRNYKRPGWCYACVGRGNTDVLAFRLDGSGIVERFTHHRSSQKRYNAEAHAVASPDGRKVMFVSDWNGTAEINSYVVSMPDIP